MSFIEIMADAVEQEFLKEAKCSSFHGIIADGATNVNDYKQFNFCVRRVQTKTLDVQEEYLGIYSAPESRVDTFHSTMKDMNWRLGLEFHCIHDHCFDGAANMCGRCSGVTKKISYC